MGSDMLLYSDAWERRIQQGEGRAVLLSFLQMMKSLCRHFVLDEHYTCFDDLYNPEYAAESLMRMIQQHRSFFKAEDMAFFQEAWKEIEQSEAVQEYGILRRLAQVCE